MDDTITQDSSGCLIEDIKFTEYHLGYNPDGDKSIFRFFCPRATIVSLALYRQFDDKSPRTFEMLQDKDGIWNLAIYEELDYSHYGFLIDAPEDLSNFLYSEFPVADPFCKMATTVNNYQQYPKSLLLEEEPFDWQNDDFVPVEDPRDLIIYECHLKDMTQHPSARCNHKGTYSGFVEDNQRGGIQHLKDIGVNAVEFLPLQKFAYYEPPYNTVTPDGFNNIWNYYSKNYWGYMTSFYFVPETMYASDGTNQLEAVIGKQPTAIHEFKTMVRELHKQNIAVIMDVVYNHVSQYDLNPLKFIDLDYFFYIDHEGNLRSNSGTGNDFKTHKPIARKLIIDSLKYWMKKFHVDGFRFDLANMIDRETVDLIRKELTKINPDVILIAEPWGDGYNPNDFSKRGWAAWNDQIRNGVKGSDPAKDRGYIFGEWQHNTNRHALENFIRGTLASAENGRFQNPAHSVNYLEAHDGFTLGDFIRIGLNPTLSGKKVKDKNQITKLNERQLACAKLAALFLFCSQGITMIHEGQEWGRAKIIVDKNPDDPNVGTFDHNSYEKDNETNYLDFDEISLNQSLYNYYKQLIKFRKQTRAFRRAGPDDIVFHVFKDPLHLTFTLYGESSKDDYDYFISLNANPAQHHHIKLPEGFWELIVDDQQAKLSPVITTAGSFLVKPTSGVILRKLRK